jgi:hypothetical protein
VVREADAFFCQFGAGKFESALSSSLGVISDDRCQHFAEVRFQAGRFEVGGV